MICQTWNVFDLFPTIKAKGFQPTLTAYCPNNSKEIDIQRLRPTILVLPGGGYEFTSDREAEPVALNFVGEGFNALVLRYSVKPARYPQALLEAAACMAFIRRHSAELHADPQRIAVCGFSAGGHLAGTLSTLWNRPFLSQKLHLSAREARPDAAILGYAVLTAGPLTHQGSISNLLGSNLSSEERDQLSVEKQVAADTPPMFLWATANDNCVPVENSLLMATALSKSKIPFELHIFPKGVHGLSLCDRRTGTGGDLDNPSAGQWVPLCKNWLKNVFPD